MAEAGTNGACIAVMQSPPKVPVCKLQELPEVHFVEEAPASIQVTAQLMKTSEDLERMKKKYDRTCEELHQLKLNHSKCLQKLQDTYSELNQVHTAYTGNLLACPVITAVHLGFNFLAGRFGAVTQSTFAMSCEKVEDIEVPVLIFFSV